MASNIFKKRSAIGFKDYVAHKHFIFVTNIPRKQTSILKRYT